MPGDTRFGEDFDIALYVGSRNGRRMVWRQYGRKGIDESGHISGYIKSIKKKVLLFFYARIDAAAAGTVT